MKVDALRVSFWAVLEEGKSVAVLIDATKHVRVLVPLQPAVSPVELNWNVPP